MQETRGEKRRSFSFDLSSTPTAAAFGGWTDLVPGSPHSGSTPVLPAIPNPLLAHKRTRSAPLPNPLALDTLPAPIGFAFSHPKGTGAPEVKFSADVENPWKRRQSVALTLPLAAEADLGTFERCPGTAKRTFRAQNDAVNMKTFNNNKVCTTKYTPLTFCSSNLYEQFRRLANFYFLFISILQFLPVVSSVQPTTWFPLTIVIVANMIKEAMEDIRRHWMDEEMNRCAVSSAVPGGYFMEGQWKHVCVGHVVMIREDESLPADIIVLATSDAEGGLAYIETSQLDGETNLKHRESIQAIHQALLAFGLALESTQRLTPEGCRLLEQLWVEAEPPNDRLHTFVGTLHAGATKVAVGNKQTMYRGCYLRNTAWVLGLVVYTGMDTKLMRNAMHKRFKTTSLDKLTNRYVAGIFWFLAVLCLVSGALCAVFIALHPAVPWYLLSDGAPLLQFLVNTFTFLILYSYIVPISLTVTSEIVKMFHAYFINNDLEMCHTDRATGIVTPAQARTSNLGEDLGRVVYVFSDKTGTLTRNVMEYMKCSILGVRYGTGMTEIGAAAMAAGRAELMGGGGPEEGNIALAERPKTLVLEPGNNFWDPRISDGAWEALPEPHRAAVESFHLHLALCHTILAKGPSNAAEWTPATVHYQASSPDELALVLGAKGQGFFFLRRAASQVEVVVAGEIRSYEVLNICEFNSLRKRMSCVVRMPDGRLMLLCKGADNVIYALLEAAQRTDPACTKTQQHLQAFANEGLRTLVLAERELEPAVYEAWNARYLDALTAPDKRDERLHDVAVEIEVGLKLVGATAIEDKLQEGVPDALGRLLAAGVKVWMLTGDKVETAINIALACNLVQSHMHVERLMLDEEEGAKGDRATLEAQLLAAQDSLETQAVALVVDGIALQALLDDEARLGMAEMGLFLQVASLCQAVVCCRVSPKQKADVVQLVRKKRHVITVSIGDGANDVPMIQNANIGVGISGKEGMQAVMASDYAVAQFAYLQRLLLVHGRWSCQRICVLILYFFYKNCHLSLLCFWFGFHTEFSGINFMDDVYNMVWNCVFTAFPIFCTAIHNKDFLYPVTLLAYPELYQEVQGGQDFTLQRFCLWMLDAIYVSLVVFYVPVLALNSGPTWQNGQDNGLGVLFLTSFFCLHLVSNLRLALVTRTWPWSAAIIMFLSIASFFPFSYVHTLLPIEFQGHLAGSVWRTISMPAFWLCTFLTSALCLLPPYWLMVAHKVFHPSRTQILAEQEAQAVRMMAQRGEVPTDPALLHHYTQLRERRPRPRSMSLIPMCDTES